MKKLILQWGHYIQSIFLPLLLSTRPSNQYHQLSEKLGFDSKALNGQPHFKKEIKIFLSVMQLSISKLKKEGFKLGVNSKGNAPYSHEPIEIFYAHCDKEANVIYGMMDEEKNHLDKQYKIANKEYEISVKERVTNADQLNRTTYNEAAVSYERQKEDTVVIEEEKNTCDEKIGFYDNEIYTNENLIGGVPLQKIILDSGVVLVGSSVILGFLDSNAIIDSFKVLRLATNIGYVLGWTLSIQIVLSSYLMAKAAIKNETQNWWQGFYLGMTVIVFILFVRIAGNIELSNLTGESFDFVGCLIFSGLNALIWFLTYIVDKVRQFRAIILLAQENVEKYRKDREEVIKKRAKLVAKLNRILALNDKRKTLYIQDYQAQIVNKAKSKHKACEARKLKLEEQAEAVQTTMTYFKYDVENIKKLGKKTYEEAYRLGKAKQRPPIKLYNKIGILLFPVFLCAVSSCRIIEEQIYGKPDHHITILIKDETIEPENQNQYNLDKLFDFFTDDLWKLNIGIPRTKVDFYLTSVDDLFIQKTTHVSLQEGEPESTRIEWDRVDTIASYKGQFKNIIEENMVYGEGKKHSKINACLCRNLNFLADADSSAIKTLVLLSDNLEHSETSSFYAYRDNPQDLIGSNFDLIAEAFRKECPLKDLSGITVIGVFTPSSPELSELIQYAVKFLDKYLSEHNAKFEFRASF